MLTEDQLIRLLAQIESDHVERTESLTNTDKFGQAICAFANDLPNRRQPGYLSIGVTDDPYCLSLLKHYRSLIPMAMEAHKPIFFLKSVDGAIGAHSEAVRSCYSDVEKLASKIAASAGVAFPAP
jgi:hypothetical protein